jgi:type II secretory pathway component PulL
MTPKTEDQIAKDKEAVAKMVGAKSAMEAAQRRIELLEACLRQCNADMEGLQRVIGDRLCAPERQTDGTIKATPIFNQFQIARNRIEKVQP